MMGAPTTGLRRFEAPLAMVTMGVGTKVVPGFPKLPVIATRSRWR